MMDQGPVLILSFTAQQIMAIRDSSGRVVEGDPVSCLSNSHADFLDFFSPNQMICSPDV